MFTVRRTSEFDAWVRSLRDGLTQKRLIVRLKKVQLGNLGDVQPVGDGVFEMREHFGPGWRMYYVQRGAVLIVMLGWRQIITAGRYSGRQAPVRNH